MFQRLRQWWRGEMIEVEIIECRNEINGWLIRHTLVSCPDKTRRYVNGHLGSKGEKIMVNTWDLGQY